MKKLLTIIAAAALGLATVGIWAADAPPTTAPAGVPPKGPGGPGKMPGMHRHMDGPMGMKMGMGMMGMGRKMEKATFLGVGVSPASPVLQAQLSLPKGSGMVVDAIAPESPADKAGLKQYDIVAKLNDQILFNLPQLTALVHTFKAGDAVTLTVVHEGKSIQVPVTLAEKEQPVMEMGGMGMMPGMPGMGGGMMPWMHPGMGGSNGFKPRWPDGSDRDGRDGREGRVNYEGRKGRDGRDGHDRDDDDDNDDKPEKRD